MKDKSFLALNAFALSRTRFTPDIATLELSQFQLVFLCDDLMYSGKNYKILRDHSARIGRGFTLHGYNFYRKRTDGTPVVMTSKQTENRYDFSCLKIKGEIHSIESPAMTKLDTHYQNGLQYRRNRTKILYPTRRHGVIENHDTMGRPLPYTLQGKKHFLLPERVDMITAWMYTGVPNYWNNLIEPIDGGFIFEQVRIEEPKEERRWLIKYYHFRNQP
jgi:hypothetical protein